VGQQKTPREAVFFVEGGRGRVGEGGDGTGREACPDMTNEVRNRWEAQVGQQTE